MPSVSRTELKDIFKKLNPLIKRTEGEIQQFLNQVEDSGKPLENDISKLTPCFKDNLDGYATLLKGIEDFEKRLPENIQREVQLQPSTLPAEPERKYAEGFVEPSPKAPGKPSGP